MSSAQALKILEKEPASAEKKLRSNAGVCSVSSEERDVALEGQRVQEELEWKSNASSVSLPSKHRSEEGHKSNKSSDVGSACSGGNGKSYRQMPGRLSSRTARDQEAAASSSSGLEVGLQQAAIVPSSWQTAGSGGGSAVGSGVGNPGSSGVGNSGGSTSKSAARPSAEAREGEGSGVGSASESGTLVSNTCSRSAPRGQGSSLTGNSATPASVMLEHIPPSQKEQVAGHVADMESQVQELDDLRRQLAASEEARIVNSETLRQEVAETHKKMRAMKKKIAAADTVAEILAMTQERLTDAQDARDDLIDKMVGMDAAHKQKLERNVEEIKGLQEEILEQRRSSRQAKSDADDAEEEANDKRKVLAQELMEMQNAMAIMRKAEMVEMNAKEIVVGQQVIELESRLSAKQREVDRQDELLNARLRIHEMQQEKERDEKNLRLTAGPVQASPSSSSNTGPLGVASQKGKGRPGVRKPIDKGGGGMAALASIDEEESEEIGSQAGSCISGQVSSDGDVNVASMDDFDEDAGKRHLMMPTEAETLRAASLRAEIQEALDKNQELRDKDVGKDAEYWAKRERLFCQLQGLRATATANRIKMAELEKSNEDLEAEKTQELEDVHKKLDRLKKELAEKPDREETDKLLNDQKVIFGIDLDEVQQQLQFAVEGKRLAIARLDDTRRELEAAEHRHTRVVSDLQARLQLSGMVDVNHSDNDLMEHFRAVEEERNVLRNELECERLQSQEQLENEQQEHAVHLSKLRESNDLLHKERELNKKLQESIDLLHMKVEAAQKTNNEAIEQAAALEAMHRKSSAQSTGFFGSMRCPTRALQATLPPQVDSEQSLQAVMWQILSAIRGITALLCNSESWKILDASKKAFSLWGSAALRGSSLFSLIYDQATASWLKIEIATNFSPAFPPTGSSPGFWLRELGCVEFRSRLGSALDSQVICARLPEEPRHARPAVHLVIVEPMQEDQKDEKQMQGQPQQFFARAAYQSTGSRAPSVLSEDITANDSVSMVNAGY